MKNLRVIRRLSNLSLLLWVILIGYISYHFAGTLWDYTPFKGIIAISMGYITFTTIKLNKP